MTDKHFWPFFITGLIIVWAVPLFAHWLDDAMAAYWLGVALAWLWREWVQREIDKRRRASDERAHESLQEWYEKKLGEGGASTPSGYAHPVKNVLTYGDQ